MTAMAFPMTIQLTTSQLVSSITLKVIPTRASALIQVSPALTIPVALRTASVRAPALRRAPANGAITRL